MNRKKLSYHKAVPYEAAPLLQPLLCLSSSSAAQLPVEHLGPFHQIPHHLTLLHHIHQVRQLGDNPFQVSKVIL